ncbi:bacteriophage abortive infection AbiH family protein [Vibrio harveyi]|uniref:bacteriophage abortive infection AbiH family protein n=1 Tax=Vibrio harveyi TaxID=669 RepID=UPI00068056D3|nr:bacteriophage abortive infection AbiH family protein [Vibrio harveyi]PNM43637.1 hypothetical protein AL469_027700 [Vibrio harveyi]
MKLYIIGNGFDIHHKLDTYYTTFGLYLKEHNREVYDLLVDHFGFSDLVPTDKESMSDPLWSEFEHSLSLLDTSTVMENFEDYLPVYSSDDFRDSDRYSFEIEMERVLGQLTTDLYACFKKFILSVKLPTLNRELAVNLDRDALYLTFNYTNTLNHYYDIPDDNVLFIHEKAQVDDVELVLGHGVDPKNFEDKPAVPPADLSHEDYDRWCQDQADQYDDSYERGKDMINRYFTVTFKGTDKIIDRNSEFFDSLSSIEEVFVLGHSLAEVDLPYFRKIVSSVNPDIKWTVSYYLDTDRPKHLAKLKSIGVRNAVASRIENI